MTHLSSQRHLFHVDPDVSYFNCAYIGPLLKSVVAAGETALRRRARPWRISAADFFAEVEQTRPLFAHIVGGRAAQVAIIPAISYAVASAGRNLPCTAGDVILGLARQYPSNVYGWRTLARETGAQFHMVERAPGGTWTEALLNAIDNRTAIVAIPHMHWADGQVIDLAAVAAAARSRGRGGKGAALFLDLSQSAGALPIDVAAIEPDFIAAVGYKWLLGPYGVAFMHVHERWLDGRPLEETWTVRADADNFNRLVEYTEDYMPGAARFDGGERAHFETLPMAIATLQQIAAWGVGNISETLGILTAEIVSRAEEFGFTAEPAEHRAPHYLMLRHGGGLNAAFAERLAAQGVYASVRGDGLRITPHLHVNAEDVKRLIAALASV